MPPLTKPQSICSCATRSPIQSTDSHVARSAWRTASAPLCLAHSSATPAMPAETQPPLRPDAPKPATSRSITRTRSDGSASSRAYAVQRPVMPAPTIATSQSVSPCSAGRGRIGPGNVSSQRLRSRMWRSSLTASVPSVRWRLLLRRPRARGPTASCSTRRQACRLARRHRGHSASRQHAGRSTACTCRSSRPRG